MKKFLAIALIAATLTSCGGGKTEEAEQKVDSPVVETPVVEAPKVDSPVVAAPKVDSPVVAPTTKP